ncbi:RecQ-mediated genome instability protein 2 [Bagarius yarrelli]|uniref:RecQ-mediated genome instability protein 2 n=1 Tax=Bagarius yarrelli TaxID=175774 RepID=A0A556V2B7_BAGYA|nr:RecQ-mediated genome instability protein 2 [Bagarius yarrelli]
MSLANISSSESDKLKRPPVKVLSSQLREGKGCAAGSGKTELSIRRLGGGAGGESLTVSVVWMQGTVVEAQTNQNSVLLLDETGNFHITGVNNIPRGKPCLSPGKYVMVMGFIQSHGPEPVLRAVKIADLSDNADVHRKTWKYEVEDLQQTLP